MAANNTAPGPTNHQRVSQNNVKQFKCDLCDKSFTQRRNQRAHIRTVHEKLKPFQCTHCGLTANRKFNLMSHIKKMHGSIEGNSVIDRRLSGSNSANVVQSSANNTNNSAASGNNSTTSSSTSKKKQAGTTGTTVATNTESSQQCLVCAQPVKLGINKYFCDKCDQRFTTPAVTNNHHAAAAHAQAGAMSNLLSNVQGRNFSPQTTQHHSPHPQTYRCLQCSFFTDDSNAMIGHHLHAHSSYPMPM